MGTPNSSPSEPTDRPVAAAGDGAAAEPPPAVSRGAAEAPDSPETEPAPRTRRRARVIPILPTRPLASGFVLGIGVILAVALAIAVASISGVLVSVFFGLFIALGLDPAVRGLERRGLSRGRSVAIVALAFALLIVAIALVIVPTVVRQIVYLITSVPGAYADMQGSDWYVGIEAALDVDLDATIQDGLREATNLTNFLAVSGGLLQVGAGIVGAISTGFLVVVLTLYFLSSLPMMKDALAGLVPAYKRPRFTGLMEQITHSVGSVVAGGITLSSINAVVVLALQFAVGSSAAVLLAIVAFFITMLPMIGSVLFLVIGGVASLFISPTAALIFAVGYLVYMQIEAYVVTPRIMGRAVAVPGILVITGAMIGAALMGLLGALVAIPITASILIILRQVVVPKQDAQTEPPDE
ncbi:AI-2E family transporter [Microbacterium halophytorum]|uniref:AI-2E family transporter n=1 Tax=Microbacterium halophytorum TaxID=2067568 RepID=UPI001319F96C|nr:AI-2E family transporter [Microbacterium halophytorum]